MSHMHETARRAPRCVQWRSGVALAAVAVVMASIASPARGQSLGTWTGSGADANWGTAGNWTGGPPTTTGTWGLTFTGTNQAVSGTVTASDNIGATTTDTVTINSLSFLSTGSTVFNLTRSGSRSLTLTDGGTISTQNAAGANRDVINIPITLSGSATFNLAHDLLLGQSVSGGTTLTKSGTGTLFLSGSNSYGTTTISQGILQVGVGSTAGSLGTGAVTNSGTLAFNRSDSYGGAVSNNISGSGLVTLAGGVLTLSGSNSHTGGTQINGGTLKIGSQYALGGNNANVTVASGGVLDVAGLTAGGTTGSVTRYNLSLNGSGNGTDGALTNTGNGGTLYLASGTLAGDSVISLRGSSGTLVIDSSGSISGTASTLTVNATTGLQFVGGSVNVGALVKNGGGSLEFNTANAAPGSTRVNQGTLTIRNVTFGTGTIFLGDTTGANNVTLSLGRNGTPVFSNLPRAAVVLLSSAHGRWPSFREAAAR